MAARSRPALVSGLMAPQSPAAERWETLWHYMQSGPGVFKGDLYFYGIDGDIRGRLGEIDTAACPLYLLTGEYDYSPPPRTRWRWQRRCRGQRSRSCAGSAISRPARTRNCSCRYIEPVLAEIAARG